MKNPIQRNNHQNRFSVNMTPLIDIIFLLMIFFLLAINFQKPEGAINNMLPQMGRQGNSDATKDWETVSLKIKMVRKNNLMKIYLQERVVFTYTDLLHYLNQLPHDILIIIEPDDNVPYKHVIGVYNICMKSKKKDIVFSLST